MSVYYFVPIVYKPFKPEDISNETRSQLAPYSEERRQADQDEVNSLILNELFVEQGIGRKIVSDLDDMLKLEQHGLENIEHAETVGVISLGFPRSHRKPINHIFFDSVNRIAAEMLHYPKSAAVQERGLRVLYVLFSHKHRNASISLFPRVYQAVYEAKENYSTDDDLEHAYVIRGLSFWLLNARRDMQYQSWKLMEDWDANEIDHDIHCLIRTIREEYPEDTDMRNAALYIIGLVMMSTTFFTILKNAGVEQLALEALSPENKKKLQLHSQYPHGSPGLNAEAIIGAAHIILAKCNCNRVDIDKLLSRRDIAFEEVRELEAEGLDNDIMTGVLRYVGQSAEELVKENNLYEEE